MLDDFKRVIVQRAIVRAIANRDSGNLTRYLEAPAISEYLDLGAIAKQTIRFTIPGTQYEGIGYEANEFHFADKTFVEWEEGNITCYQISGNYKAWKNGVKRKNGEVFFKDSPKGVSHIEKLINNGGY
ncbi:MAG: hypothetical protein IIB38_16075 [Candidatus Hydrogenedentes bacterium]|nr:hypothetical protein [Candidatus Hydrogenedentota bacterium]